MIIKRKKQSSALLFSLKRFDYFSRVPTMLLAIDIGNSTIVFGIFENGGLISKFTVPTAHSQTAEEIYSQINSRINSKISRIFISTVVTETVEPFQKLSEKYLNLKPVFVDSSFDFGLEINYFPPESLGSDRIVAAFAAARKYKAPCVVCDFGTATTIDLVNSRNEFVGGIIAPGMKILADALRRKTSKLPEVEIIKPENVFGNTTQKAIQSGIYFGYIGLVDGIIERMIKEFGEKPNIISTGGFAEIIAESSEFVEIIEKDLILEGLYLLSEKMNRKR